MQEFTFRMTRKKFLPNVKKLLDNIVSFVLT